MCTTPHLPRVHNSSPPPWVRFLITPVCTTPLPPRVGRLLITPLKSMLATSGYESLFNPGVPLARSLGLRLGSTPPGSSIYLPLWVNFPPTVRCTLYAQTNVWPPCRFSLTVSSKCFYQLSPWGRPILTPGTRLDPLAPIP